MVSLNTSFDVAIDAARDDVTRKLRRPSRNARRKARDAGSGGAFLSKPISTKTLFVSIGASSKSKHA
jgi:hypothetical protein